MLIIHLLFISLLNNKQPTVPNKSQSIQGNHILIDREDRRSQLRTFKEGLNWLKNGVSIMAFPEGARSPDGKLMDFKGGTFSMAIKAGVPIVPLTISHAHAVMPSYSLFPIQAGAGKLALHVHPPIYPSSKDNVNLTDADLSKLVREAILSKLPADQHPHSAADSEAS
jgi:1-acyl-sn-glycerol-3-phosphate acyltransferase